MVLLLPGPRLGNIVKSSVVLEYGGQGYILTVDGHSEPFGSDESMMLFDYESSFRFVSPCGDFLARKEWRGKYSWSSKYPYWYAFKRFGRRVRKVYLGRPFTLTLAGLEDAAALLYSRRNCEPYGPWLPLPDKLASG